MKRIHINLTDEMGQKLDSLTDELGAITKTRTIVMALNTLAWIVEEEQAGRKLGSENKDGSGKVHFKVLT